MCSTCGCKGAESFEADAIVIPDADSVPYHIIDRLNREGIKWKVIEGDFNAENETSFDAEIMSSVEIENHSVDKYKNKHFLTDKELSDFLIKHGTNHDSFRKNKKAKGNIIISTPEGGWISEAKFAISKSDNGNDKDMLMIIPDDYLGIYQDDFDAESFEADSHNKDNLISDLKEAKKDAQSFIDDAEWKNTFLEDMGLTEEEFDAGMKRDIEIVNDLLKRLKTQSQSEVSKYFRNIYDGAKDEKTKRSCYAINEQTGLYHLNAEDEGNKPSKISGLMLANMHWIPMYKKTKKEGESFDAWYERFMFSKSAESFDDDTEILISDIENSSNEVLVEIGNYFNIYDDDLDELEDKVIEAIQNSPTSTIMQLNIILEEIFTPYINDSSAEQKLMRINKDDMEKYDNLKQGKTVIVKNKIDGQSYEVRKSPNGIGAEIVNFEDEYNSPKSPALKNLSTIAVLALAIFAGKKLKE